MEEMLIQANKNSELVLVFDAKLLYGFTGLHKVDDLGNLSVSGISTYSLDTAWFKECLSRSFFMPRGAVENDPAYKQVIPYVVFRHGNLYFAYSREGAESRLTGKCSIGIGGHINITDYSKSENLENVVSLAALREVYEEVDLSSKSKQVLFSWKRFLSVPSKLLYVPNENVVNQVHFGAVYILTVTEEEFTNMFLKSEGTQLDWMFKDELLAKEGLELWSRTVLESL
jgi:predicted NUDIX family phosphoesterase